MPFPCIYDAARASGATTTPSATTATASIILYERSDFEESLWVVNPATRRLAGGAAAIRGHRPDEAHRTAGAYLAFDPSVTLHYDVFLIPEVPDEVPEGRRRHEGDEEESLELDDDAGALLV
jgi:hypothetical protein